MKGPHGFTGIVEAEEQELCAWGQSSVRGCGDHTLLFKSPACQLLAYRLATMNSPRDERTSQNQFYTNVSVVNAFRGKTHTIIHMLQVYLS
jgi:hypothetical protein